MARIIDRIGKGSALTAAEYDSALDILHGINEPQTGATHTIDVNDQGKTIEYSNASAIAVTLPAISTVSGSNIDTSDFAVTLKNIGAGVVTATCGGADTFDDGSTTQTLNQYESVTIQTDNTLGKWNILNKSHTSADLNLLDVATLGTVEASKTVTSDASSNVNFPASAGVALGGGSDVLDSYIEGTWTPTIQDASLSDAEGQAYNTQTGKYTRIGRVVFFTFHIDVSGLGSLTNGLYLAGLPTAASGTGGASITNATGLGMTAGTSLIGHIDNGNTYMTLNNYDSTAGTTQLQVSEATGTFVLYGHGFYMV